MIRSVERTPQWGGYGGMLPVGFSERVITRSTGFTVNAVVVWPHRYCSPRHRMPSNSRSRVQSA